MAAHDGGCLCGAIRYRVSGEPIASVACYCRDCQHAAGAGPNNMLLLKKDQLEILRGRPRAYWNFAESGHRVGRHYCETCGAPLFQETAAHRDMAMVKVGSLDDPSAFPPQTNVWTASAQPWMHVDASLPTFAQEPGSDAPREPQSSGG
ncbi:MAG: uncharacterized protein JWN93_3940 [Hyphomicrobiales bacterium]|jgi:hypothetical protein|nr:uncharacterized protein [Hyphomicrobiales bacterium]